jgi:hypothetical protein
MNAAGSDAGGRDRDRARTGFRRRDDVLELRLRHILAADHHIAKPVDQRDRHEIPERIVSQLRIQRRVERHVGKPADQQRIAIRLALGGGNGAHDGASASLVLDEEGLSHALRKRVGEISPDQIVAAAGTDRDDDLHGSVGIGSLRLRHRNTEREQREPGGDPCQHAIKSLHASSGARPATNRLCFRADCATCRSRRQHDVIPMEIGPWLT